MDVVYVNKPYLDEKYKIFEYNGKEQVVGTIGNYNAKAMIQSGTWSAVSADTYEIHIKLNSTDSITYMWDDGSTDDIILEWTINPITIPKPNVTPLKYEYDGSGLISTTCYKMPTISGFDSNILDWDGDGTTRQYKAGKYPIRFSIKDTSSCTWDDGSDEDYVVTWEITPSVFKIPLLLGEDYVYDGQRHYPPDIDNYNENVMSRSGNTSYYTNAGEYYITYDLRDKDSCTWEDGSTDSKTIYWNINKKVIYVDKPYLEEDQKEFAYDGTEHKPNIINYNGTYMTATGTISSVAANAEDTPWIINISLNTTTNYTYLWNVENDDDKSEENQTKQIV